MSSNAVWPKNTEKVLKCMPTLLKKLKQHLACILIDFILDDVMKTENWKKMKEENLAELFEFQQMLLSTAETN
jgi:hypothetical protein